jgi:hypothetical protein
MGRLGFEPRTIRLKAEYSTVELATRLTYVFDTVYNNNMNWCKNKSILEEICCHTDKGVTTCEWWQMN